MSLLHKFSTECTKSELDLFGVPPTQVAYDSGRIVQYYPVATISDGPIEFNISGSSSEEYIDPSQTYILIEAKIERSDNKEMGEEEICAPCNNIIGSMFSQVDIYLNDTLITSSVNTYAYRAYIETLLNYGTDAKKSHLTAGLWYKDSAGKMNSNTNVGLIERCAITKNKTFQAYGRVHADLFFQDKLLINNVHMRVRFSRNKDAFCLFDEKGGPYQFKILKAVLSIRKVKVNPNIILAHAKTLETENLTYPIKRVETKVYSIPQGLTSKIIDNVSLGPLPKKIVFGLVSSAAYDGNIRLNGFNFQHFNLQKISVSVDGEEAPNSPIEMNFEDGNFILGYYSLFNGLDRAGVDAGNDISRKEFPEGYTLFAFDLSPDSCNQNHFNLVKNGNLRISLSFTKGLSEAVNCLVYMEHENIIEINTEI